VTEYLITFNDEWVPDFTPEEVREKAASARPVIEEMKAAGVFLFSNGGLDASTAVCSVKARDGEPIFTDGPYVESKEHLGGFAVVDVPDDAAARYPAGSPSRLIGRKRCTGSPVPPGRCWSRDRFPGRGGDRPCPPRGVGAGAFPAGFLPPRPEQARYLERRRWLAPGHPDRP
jgi:hypothetical protein